MKVDIKPWASKVEAAIRRANQWMKSSRLLSDLCLTEEVYGDGTLTRRG
jgi:hypothetical protein